MRILSSVAILVLGACGQSQSAPAPASSGESVPTRAVSTDASDDTTAVVPRVAPVLDGGVAASSPAPADASPAPAAVSLAPSKSWPFHQWDKAQAYTFNLRRPGPGATLRVFSEAKGWTPERQAGPVLTQGQAKKALQLLASTQGELIVSKCPFPRHGIVLFQGETPVGSISVCFECGDIMIWPAYSPAPNWEQQKSKRFGKLMKAYDRVFPRWEKFFGVELGLPTDWKRLARPPGE